MLGNQGCGSGSALIYIHFPSGIRIDIQGGGGDFEGENRKNAKKLVVIVILSFTGFSAT